MMWILFVYTMTGAPVALEFHYKASCESFMAEVAEPLQTSKCIEKKD